ncbi:unnamed protein product [Heligmosomoides polygyrus]|uniref:CCHC-type domain-containing protein n=1 Tax=Heligmosomoides polygyrus TaxID=6339 RepID=A0A183F7T5_HELPZ|nr:unnamed protein product [Heligmosomoides polygyrus]
MVDGGLSARLSSVDMSDVPVTTVSTTTTQSVAVTCSLITTSSIPITAPTAQLSASVFIPPQIQGSWAEHMQCEAATNTSVNTQLADTGTIEELTASQFRTVFDYIGSNNVLRDLVESLQVPPREPSQVRMKDHEAATQITHTLRIMLNAATETAHSFHNLAVLLGRGSPLRYPYTVLMSWIQVLTYQITSINVQRDQLTELVLPRLLTPSSQQDYFRNTFQSFNITEDLFRESLQYVSAVTAHATRMIRVLQAYQMLQALHYRVTPHSEEDTDYTYLLQANTPETLDPGSYLETLRWWRENYSNALMIHNTRGYLRTHEVDRMLQEQQGQQSVTTAHTTQSSHPIRQTQAPAHTGPATSVSGSPAPFGSAGSTTSAQLPAVIPQFVRPQQTPMTRTDGRSKARQEHRGQRRTRPTSPDQRSQEAGPAKKSHEDTERRTPRQRQQDSTTRTQDRRPTPPTQEDRPELSRRQLPTPAPEGVCPTSSEHQRLETPAAHLHPSLPQTLRDGACVFCNHLDHSSEDCAKHTNITDRVEILKARKLCSHCLSRHRGECFGWDPCSRCNRGGHHPAVCINNPIVVCDVEGMTYQIYHQMAAYTLRPYPRNVTPSQKHPPPTKLAHQARRDPERTTRLNRPSTPQHQEPPTSGHASRPASRASIASRRQESPPPIRRESRPRLRQGESSPSQESRVSPQAPRQHLPSFRDFCKIPYLLPSLAGRPRPRTRTSSVAEAARGKPGQKPSEQTIRFIHSIRSPTRQTHPVR